MENRAACGQMEHRPRGGYRGSPDCECLLAREGTEAEKKDLAAIKAGARAKARATGFNTCEQENPQEEGGPPHSSPSPEGTLASEKVPSGFQSDDSLELSRCRCLDALRAATAANSFSDAGD